MAFFNDMDRLSLKLLSPSGLELFAKNIQEVYNNGHKYRKIEDHKGIVEYLKAIRDGEDGSEELFNKYIKVVDIEEKVTEKKCNNCMSSGIWPSEEPCMSCILSEEMRPNWKPKQDTSEQAKKSINNIFGVNIDSIKHIEDRVESIQSNVLVYGNDIISKIIAIQDKIGMTPNADIYLKDIRQDLCDLDIKLDCLDSILKDIQKALNNLPTISDISRIEDRIINMGKIESKIDEVPTEKELEEAHEHLKKMTKDEHITLTLNTKKKPEPKFNDCDLVKISEGTSKNKVWTVKASEFNYALSCWTYLLMDVSDHDILIHEPEYRLVKYEPKFKVGDLVKYKTGSISYFVSDVKESNYKFFYDLERRFPYDKRNYKIVGILESRLEEGK